MSYRTEWETPRGRMLRRIEKVLVVVIAALVAWEVFR